MRSPMLALTWQHWWRHRLGLSLVPLCLFAFAVLFNALPAERMDPLYGFLCSLVFFVALAYVTTVFAFGFETKLEGRESGFPARLFTLPVRTGVLAGWPLLQSVLVVTLLWAAWAGLVLRPAGIDPAWWTRLLIPAALVAVLHALVWLPLGLAWVRVIVALLALPVLVVLPQYPRYFAQ